MNSLKQELRLALPIWAVAVLLPAPAIITARNGSLGLIYFFVAAIAIVADIFWRGHDRFHDDVPSETADWLTKLAASACALLAAWIVFATCCLPLPPRDAVVCSGLAFLALIPALCVTPWLLGVTRNPYYAAVFTLTLVACMKLLGCLVVVIVHGWDACERGYTTMPWTEPNLLVVLFLAFTATLSAFALRKVAAANRSFTPRNDVYLGAEA